MSIIVVAIVLFIIIIFMIYTNQSSRIPNNDKEKFMIKQRPIAQDISPVDMKLLKTPEIEYPKINSKTDTCKISNQLGCKLVEGSKIYTEIREGVVMLSVNQSWQGTGFFVSPDGYIVTAAHVISEPKDENDDKGAIIPAKEIYALVAPNYDVYKCRVVGIDGTGDIGVLKIDMDDPFNKNNGPIKIQKYLSFTDEVKTGDLAFVLGYPLGTDLSSFSMGIVRNEKFVAPSLFIPFNVILITSPAYQGNSGSPIVNANGDVIGLLTFVYYANEQTFESIGGGPTSSIVSYVSQRLIEADKKKLKGDTIPAYFDRNSLKYKKGYMGFDNTKVVWFSDIPVLVEKYKFPFKRPIGFRGQVSKNSPLYETLGSKDIIVRIDGKEIGALPNQTAPGDILWRKIPGEKITIEYYPLEGDRYGSLKTLEVKLQDYPDGVDTFEGRALKVEMSCIGDECSLASSPKQDDFWIPSSKKRIGF
jgi:serine protease Do